MITRLEQITPQHAVKRFHSLAASCTTLPQHRIAAVKGLNFQAAEFEHHTAMPFRALLDVISVARAAHFP
jgi:hypothetical protein